MASRRRQFKKVTVTSNVDDFAGMFDRAAHNLPKRITGGTSNDKPYAIFVEIGTSKMEPRAPVRKSEPVIEAEQDQMAKRLSFPPTTEALLSAANHVIDTAHDNIVTNTPRSLKDFPGYTHMQDDWNKEEAQAHD